MSYAKMREQYSRALSRVSNNVVTLTTGALEAEFMVNGLRPLFVGEAPGPRTRVCRPLYPFPKNSAGYHLFDMSPFDHRGEYLRACCRINLLSVNPDNGWPTKSAKAAADNLRASGLLEGRTVIMLGRRVYAAFYSKCPMEPCVIGLSLRGKCCVALLPHPSGRNRWYDDPTNKKMAEDFLREVFS